MMEEIKTNYNWGVDAGDQGSRKRTAWLSSTNGDKIQDKKTI